MFNTPKLLPIRANRESFAGVSYHLDGELVPALTVEISNGYSVYFEHHTLLWKNTSINIGLKTMSGVFKRVISGMPIFMTEATGNGQISFSRDGVGHVFPMHLKVGEKFDIREHQFLAATGNIDYTFKFVKGVSNILFGGAGLFVDEFYANQSDGIIWLYGYGNVFEIVLAPGEQIDVEPGAWLYKDVSLDMETVITGITTGLFASSSITLNRFTGPGRVGIQSMSTPLYNSEQQIQSSANVAQVMAIANQASNTNPVVSAIKSIAWAIVVGILLYGCFFKGTH